MHEAGEAGKGALWQEFNRSVMVDFQGAKMPGSGTFTSPPPSRWHFTTERCLGMISPVVLFRDKFGA